jgi:ribosomal protein S18 acetylase RimI-like enzyme
MTERAAFDDVPAIRTLLAEAYADDPLSEWIFPDPETRPHACGAWYGLFAEQYVQGARATVVREGSRITAVALWRLPGDEPLSSNGVPGIAGLMTALVGPERVGAIGDGLHAVGTVQPREPHAYLNFLAVAADRRRTGLGRLVLQPLVDAARRAQLFAHLETTNPGGRAGATGAAPQLSGSRRPRAGAGTGGRPPARRPAAS